MKRATIFSAMLLASTPLAASPDLAPSAPAADPSPPEIPEALQPTGRWSAYQGGNAQTPPMGWNSWNAFKTDITEEKVMASAQKIVDSGLADLGYRYINIDDGWWLRRRQSDGRILVRTGLFPSADTGGAQHSSLKPFVDNLHNMGLKAGIYTDIGHNSCAQTHGPNRKNNPVGTQAEREIGLKGHVEKDVALFFQEWGFDYVKVDACGITRYGPNEERVEKYDFRPVPPLIVQENISRTDIAGVKALYAELGSALEAANPDGDFVYSICNWGTANVLQWGKDHGNLWRTSGDIKAYWSKMLHVFDSASRRALYAGPGTWNDPDMLFIGSGEFDENHLTEARSHFALWAISNAPLLIGYDLREAPQSLMDIFGNEEVIALNQDPAGHQAILAFDSDDVQIFVKTLSQRGDKAVAIFNRGQGTFEATLTADHLKFRGDQPVAATDLWSGEELAPFQDELSFTLEPRETRVLRVAGTPELESGVYISEIPGRVNVAADGMVTPFPDPRVYRPVDPRLGTRTDARGYYPALGGAQADQSAFGGYIRMGGKIHLTGLGLLANSRLEVRNNAEFSQFQALVGVDDASFERNEKVQFRVYGDGKLLTQTDYVSVSDAPTEIRADITGAQIVELVAQASSGKTAPFLVTWADARLVK